MGVLFQHNHIASTAAGTSAPASHTNRLAQSQGSPAAPVTNPPTSSPTHAGTGLIVNEITSCCPEIDLQSPKARYCLIVFLRLCFLPHLAMAGEGRCRHAYLPWTPCSRSCGSGTQSRRPAPGVKIPLGCPYAQEQVCNNGPCPTPSPTHGVTSPPEEGPPAVLPASHTATKQPGKPGRE